jgi:uncharacterized phage protein gp47/JayE
MSTYGITATGFNAKPQAQILADINAYLLANIDAALNVNPPEPIGVLNGIVSAMFSELWQLMLALYSGMDPDVGTGDQLAGLLLLRGDIRLNATFTLSPGCVVNVNAGFSANAGTMIAAVTGTTPPSLFTNKTLVSSAGGGNVTVDFVAVNSGPVACNAGTLVINQALAGWNSITNSNAPTLGQSIETDPAFRLRSAQGLAAAGTSTPAAIKAAVLLQMITPTTSSNTTNCTVLFNDSDATDTNGLPPHRLEVIAYQPGNTSNDDQLLANLIFSLKAAGIGTYGLASKTATDTQGNSEVILYTRPSTVRLYVSVSIHINSATFAGDTAVQNAVAKYSTTGVSPGGTVYLAGIVAALMPVATDPSAGVAGVLGVTLSLVKLDTVTPPVATSDFALGIRQVGTIAAGDVTVIHV